MKPRILSPILVFAAMLAASCAPQPLPTEAAIQPTQTAQPSTPLPTAAAGETPVIVAAAATSRGPDLEATDPSTVRLSAGQLQLVEFFRFT